MAFKSVEEYNNNRYNGMLILQNDGDYADVIFMYRSKKDVLVGDTHYIKSADYSGYVHCCGKGCPACAKGIRVQQKLFIPMYVINQNKVLFFDRSLRFDAQLENDVFSKYPNPSDFVFRLIRHGQSGDVNTRYEIRVVGRNNLMSYDEILASLGIPSMLSYYNTVCREYSCAELSTLLSTASPAGGSYDASEVPDYQVTPRTAYSAPPASGPIVEDIAKVSIPEEISDDVYSGAVVDEPISEGDMEDLDEEVNF